MNEAAERQTERRAAGQCDGYAGDAGASAPRCESYRGHPGAHFIRFDGQERAKAERRATVERIRERLMESDGGHESGWVWPILDEEAAR